MCYCVTATGGTTTTASTYTASFFGGSHIATEYSVSNISTAMSTNTTDIISSIYITLYMAICNRGYFRVICTENSSDTICANDSVT